MSKKLAVKYWNFTITVTDSEYEYSYDGVIETLETDDVREQVNNRFLKDFFGEETKFEDDYYQDEFGERIVRFSSAKEIPKAHFDILKQYMIYLQLDVSKEKVVMI